MPEQWYYAKSKVTHGPVDRAALVALFENGTLSRSALVWREGMAEWVAFNVLEALLLADRIVVMREGVIVASGTPHEMMNDPRDDEVRKLMDTPRRQMTRVAAMLDGARRP